MNKFKEVRALMSLKQEQSKFYAKLKQFDKANAITKEVGNVIDRLIDVDYRELNTEERKDFYKMLNNRWNIAKSAHEDNKIMNILLIVKKIEEIDEEERKIEKEINLIKGGL